MLSRRIMRGLKALETSFGPLLSHVGGQRKGVCQGDGYADAVPACRPLGKRILRPRHLGVYPEAISIETFARPAEDGGTGRMRSRSRSLWFCLSTNLTANPVEKCLTTRPTQTPIASGVPIGGCS